MFECEGMTCGDDGIVFEETGWCEKVMGLFEKLMGWCVKVTG